MAEQAVERLGENDFKGFEVGLVGVRTGLPCLTDILTQQGAADIHLLEGAADWQGGDPEAARDHLWAAYWVDPRLPSVFLQLPRPKELQALWESFALVEHDWTILPPATGGRVFVDGEPSYFVLDDAPWIYQFQNPPDEVETTLYLPAGEVPPEYPELRSKLKRRVLRAGLGAGVGFALGAYTAYRYNGAHDSYLEGVDDNLRLAPTTLSWVNRGSLVTAGLLSAVTVTGVVRLIRSYRYFY